MEIAGGGTLRGVQTCLSCGGGIKLTRRGGLGELPFQKIERGGGRGESGTIEKGGERRGKSIAHHFLQG